jgi:hypothetical protein
MVGKPHLLNFGGCRRSVYFDDRVGCSMNEWQLLETGFRKMNGRKLSGYRRSLGSFQHPTFCPERTMSLCPTILEAALELGRIE